MTTPNSISRMGGTLLTDDMLSRFAGRPPDDPEARVAADLHELCDAGYLLLNVPIELGGYGRTLAQTAREQRRLAYYAASTALAVNVHLYWTGVAADLWRQGDSSLQWLLEEAARGEVFAAGHRETSHQVTVLRSTTRAERVEGGYRFTGHKAFGSLTPLWTYLGLHGLDGHDPSAPRIVHAFMHRNTEGYRIEQTVDDPEITGQSDRTFLDGTFVAERYIARVVPAGAAGIDRFVLALFAWALIGFGNVYCGLARRALDLAIEAERTKRAVPPPGTMINCVELTDALAVMSRLVDELGPNLDRVADHWPNAGDDRGTGPAQIFAAARHAVDASGRVIDLALNLADTFDLPQRGLERVSEEQRLVRRHPAHSLLTHELVATTPPVNSGPAEHGDPCAAWSIT